MGHAAKGSHLAFSAELRRSIATSASHCVAPRSPRSCGQAEDGGGKVRRSNSGRIQMGQAKISLPQNYIQQCSAEHKTNMVAVKDYILCHTQNMEEDISFANRGFHLQLASSAERAWCGTSCDPGCRKSSDKYIRQVPKASQCCNLHIHIYSADGKLEPPQSLSFIG